VIALGGRPNMSFKDTVRIGNEDGSVTIS
jgi:hypothetical protein